MPRIPVISFCIPTYNRGIKVFELVSNILKYEEDNIEVVVLDNCSTDNTIELLTQINDTRFRLVINEENIGGIKNPYKSLSIAEGEFCFLCLDKDFVDYKAIGELINKVTLNEQIVFGHCELNKQNEILGVSIFDIGFHSIYNMAYLSAHPSGMFYKKDIFIRTEALKTVFETDEIFGFQFELINAEMAMMGKGLKINIPAFFTETKEECGNVASFTYKNADDVFFSPKKQLTTFQIYCKHLQTLDLNKSERQLILKKILKQFLINSTLGYRQIMKDSFICKHYHLEPQHISMIKLFEIYFKFLRSFFKTDFKISILNKLFIFLSVNFNMFFSLFRNKISLKYGE